MGSMSKSSRTGFRYLLSGRKTESQVTLPSSTQGDFHVHNGEREGVSRNQNQGLCCEFLKPLFRYGRFSSIFLHDIEPYENSQGKNMYRMRRNQLLSPVRMTVFAITLINVIITVVNFPPNIAYSYLVGFIKRASFGFFALEIMVAMYCFDHGGYRRNLWNQILEQADGIQLSFAALGIHFPSRKKIRFFGGCLCILAFMLNSVHIIVFTQSACTEVCWYKKFATKFLNTVTLNLWDKNLNAYANSTQKLLGSIGVILDNYGWNLWYFIDSVRLFSSLIVWMIFYKINASLANGTLSMENLPDIIDLHFKGTKLMNTFNKLLSPIVLFSTIFNVMYICFWINYALDFKMRFVYILGIITVVRMIALFYITADVNTQAYRISTWLEDHYAEISETPKIPSFKMNLFTSVLYNRDIIGFKGMHFFTITPAVNSAIVGTIITYCVVVQQLAPYPGNAINTSQ